MTKEATIKQLVGGKSALQNEILGDMEKEFSNGGPEGSAEMPLEELAAALAPGRSFANLRRDCSPCASSPCNTCAYECGDACGGVSAERCATSRDDTFAGERVATRTLDSANAT